MTIKLKTVLYVNIGRKYEVSVVEYCSLLSKDYRYQYDPEKKKTFYAIGCSCIDDEFYNMQRLAKDNDKCSHSTMISDEDLIEHIIELATKVPIEDDLRKYRSSIQRVYSSFKEGFDYMSQCNDILYKNL